ncbi:Serine carboxypeptidase-like 40 [Dichanthelium oligosanthes]|uniref:Carboxypeptidase n=1 Tax=Dichanthelium oligosanthes TaxID=888268 RepID=A0A1E5V848_9POAL|nr:Serine carboxypeptidase-like 40 [Dichanthelium oligosanthes]
MRSAPTFFLSLAVLLSTSLLVDASQEAQLSKFVKASRIAPLPGRSMILRPGGSKEADRIAALPGQPPRVDFEQYAGYVTVDEDDGRELFYYFVEAPHDAASKPLILWLNGGPGCSSLGYGAMMELGPFRVKPGGRMLSRNRHAWNNVANILFLESPAGVGFSLSGNATDWKSVRDGRIAEDTYLFLVSWLERFPEYKGREFYVAGESYGGHYVPQAATVITFMNRRLYGEQTPINLLGIFLGNPLLDEYLYYQGYLEFLRGHGIISDEVWADIIANGTFHDQLKCTLPEHTFEGAKIDCFNLYAPVCLRSRNGTYSSSSYKSLHARIGTWSACIPNMVRVESPAFMVPTISGDFDSTCSLDVTRYSVKDLNLAVTENWRPWYIPNGEVGGFVQQYQGGFTLASVRAAGHMVPAFQPERSLILLNSFLKNKLPPAGIPNWISL